MNGILGFTDILNEPDTNDQKRDNYIRIIQNSGEQLLHIIDNIIEISQLETKQVKIVKKEVLLNDVFLELFSKFDMKAKKNKTPLYLAKGLSDKKSIIVTDRGKLFKVLNNILENDLKYTNEGYIEFGYNLTETQSHASQIKKDRMHQQLEIYVKDTGKGIAPAKQKIIFDSFSQEEDELTQRTDGLGLGLAIAKETIKLLGGNISLESEKGEGSSFFVTIPYNPVFDKNDNIISDINPEESNAENKIYTVLIAEDEEINYLYFETILDNMYGDKIRLLHAKNGKQAVEICEINSEVDLVLMDLKMPVIDGYNATKLIKELNPDIGIIAQTAYPLQNEQNKALQAGCNDFISKPIKKEAFFKMLNKYLK